MSPNFQATMYFKYGKNKRPDVTSESTFEAILKGERTSTTRFDIWRGTERLKNLKVGDKIRFFEDKFKEGRCIDVVVDQMKRIDMSTFSEDEFEEWSKVEGWSVEYAKKISSQGGAYQILFHVFDHT